MVGDGFVDGDGLWLGMVKGLGMVFGWLRFLYGDGLWVVGNHSTLFPFDLLDHSIFFVTRHSISAYKKLTALTVFC